MVRRQEQKLMSFDFLADGKTYKVEAYVTETEVRRGNYSSVAEDPDEYFGVYHYSLDWIEEVCVYDPETEEEEYIEEEDYPETFAWILDEIEGELDQ